MKTRKLNTLFILLVTLFTMCITTSVHAAYGTSMSNPINVTLGKNYYKSWTNSNDKEKSYHKIQIGKKGILTMTFSKPFATNGEAGSLFVTVYNQNGQAIWNTVTKNSSSVGGSNYVFKLGLNPGSYYVVLESGFNLITGIFSTNYNFKFENNNYVEVEPNETLNTATNLELNHLYQASYGNDGGYYGYYDYYKFNAVKNVEYKIAIGNFTQLNSANAMILLYKPSDIANKKTTYINGAFGSIDKNGMSNYQFKATETGVYYIRVYNYYYGPQLNYQIGVYSSGKGIPNLKYQTQVQKKGWLSSVSNGATSGTVGSGLRMETLKINLENSGYSGGIEYRTHVQKKGWESTWKKSGESSGSIGEGLRLEAIQIRLTGEIAQYYDVYYRIHSQKFGWLDWTRNGASAGTSGFGFRVEAIQIKLVRKGASAPGSTTRPYVKADVTYQTQVQKKGWLGTVFNGATSGTVGQGLRMETLKINLKNQGFSGNIEYRTHIQKQGWETTWKKNGAPSGTVGLGLRLEALQLRLTGDMAKEYDIYYRVHSQKFGWLGWARNGESAGTSGYGYRLEGIQIVLVRKGLPAPGNTANHYYSV